MSLYPIGYQSQLVTMAGLRRVHEPDIHPEFGRRLWPWLESEHGRIGIGGGERPNPDPVSPASSQGRSFHQLQQFRSKLVRYAAVDLVRRMLPPPDHDRQLAALRSGIAAANGEGITSIQTVGTTPDESIGESL